MAQPRQRRLFVGTELGELKVLNYVTGAVVATAEAHAGEVSWMTYCGHTKCLISIGLDSSIAVLKDEKVGVGGGTDGLGGDSARSLPPS